MNRLLKSALDTGLAANQLAASAASNAFDRMFRTDSLVRSALTPSSVIHTQQPMVVRHYQPLEESLIPLNDGSDMEVRAKPRPVPIVIVPPLAATSLVFDLMPERSLVRYLLASRTRGACLRNGSSALPVCERRRMSKCCRKDTWL